MKPMTDVVYSSMPSDESRNLFQSVLEKQSCSLASASSDHFLLIESLVLPAFLLFLLVSRNQEDIIVVRFAKWSVRESFVCMWSRVFLLLVAHLTC
jgi:hypothetical protein